MEILEDLRHASLFMARVLMGSMFAVSAKGKLKDIKGFAKQNAIPYPLGVLVVAVEGLSAISLILGIFPRLAALAIMGLMCGTMFMHIVKWKSPYWAKEGGWEYDLIWFIVAFVLLTTGPGKIALFAF